MTPSNYPKAPWSCLRTCTRSCARSIPQQFVDRGFRARPGIHPLDDDGAIEAWTGFAVGQRLARHRPRDHPGIGGHFAIEDFARGAVDDLGRLADEHAHAEHRAFAHDAAFDHFRARTDEAVVLDDRRPGLHRLQHAADADTTRQMHVLADLRARTDRGPGVD